MTTFLELRSSINSLISIIDTSVIKLDANTISVATVDIEIKHLALIH